MFTLSNKDKIDVIERYSERLDRFGVSPKALGWDKGKQDLRYHNLFNCFNLEGKNILDIGCGFGDANIYLQKKYKKYNYIGVELVPSVFNQAREIWRDFTNINFALGDYLDMDTPPVDVVVASGIFNFKLEEGNNYDFIENVLSKAFKSCNEGIAVDFLSDKVDYKLDHTFHSCPANILKQAYKLSNNILFNNTYMPFEFSLHIFKDQNFDKADTIYTKYKNENKYYRFN